MVQDIGGPVGGLSRSRLSTGVKHDFGLRVSSSQPDFGGRGRCSFDLSL